MDENNMINNLEINYTLECHLKELSEKKTPYKKLLDVYNLNKHRFNEILCSIQTIFPTYSKHDFSHSENIISAIERILGEDNIKRLTFGDTWLILNSAYMHDFGMIFTDKEVRDIWNTPEFKDFINKCKSSSSKDLRDNAEIILNRKIEGAYWALDVKKSVLCLCGEYFRRKHCERLKKQVNDSDYENIFNFIYNFMVEERIINLIADIVLCHGCDYKEISSILKFKDSISFSPLHPRFVASLIRLGDLCDIDNNRFSEVSLKMFSEIPMDTFKHYQKHKTINNVNINSEKISMSANIMFDDIKQKARKSYVMLNEHEIDELPYNIVRLHQGWFSAIESDIKDIRNNLSEILPENLNMNFPHFEYEILVDGRKSVSSLNNMRFNFNSVKAYELIKGYGLYDDKFTFIREYLQNAIDAIKIQFWRDIKKGMYDNKLSLYINKKENKTIQGKVNYSNITPFDFDDYDSVYGGYCINVELAYKDGSAIFIIEDNGIGISIEDIEDNIVKTGYSWDSREKYKKEFNSIPDWLKVTGGFGIGLHSAFYVSDRITMISKTEYELKANEIILHSAESDGFVFSRIVDTREKRGTRIEIAIKDPNILKNNDNKNINPLEEQNSDDLLETIVSKLREYCSVTFFDIKVNGIPLQIKRYNEKFKDIFDNKKRNFVENSKDCIIDYAISDNAEEITVWNKKESIFYILNYATEPLKYNFDLQGKSSYKGMRLKSSSLSDFNFPYLLEIDILSDSSKKSIRVDRKDLLDEKKFYYEKVLKDDFSLICKILQKTCVKEIKEDDLLISRLKEVKELSFNFKDKKSFSSLPDNILNNYSMLRYFYYTLKDEVFKTKGEIISQGVVVNNFIEYFNSIASVISSNERNIVEEKRFINLIDRSNLSKIYVELFNLFNSEYKLLSSIEAKKHTGEYIENVLVLLALLGKDIADEFVFIADKESLFKALENFILSVSHSSNLRETLKPQEIFNIDEHNNKLPETVLIVSFISRFMKMYFENNGRFNKDYIDFINNLYYNFERLFYKVDFRRYLNEISHNLIFNQYTKEDMNRENNYVYNNIVLIYNLSVVYSSLEIDFQNLFSEVKTMLFRYKDCVNVFKCKDISEFVKKEIIELDIKYFNRYVFDLFPILQFLPCDEIIDSGSSLKLIYNINKKESRPIKCNKNTINKYLKDLFSLLLIYGTHIHINDTLAIPAFDEYEILSIPTTTLDIVKSNSSDIIESNRNFILPDLCLYRNNNSILLPFVSNIDDSSYYGNVKGYYENLFNCKQGFKEWLDLCNVNVDYTRKDLSNNGRKFDDRVKNLCDYVYKNGVNIDRKPEKKEEVMKNIRCKYIDLMSIMFDVFKYSDSEFKRISSGEFNVISTNSIFN